jgi:hypothetical protein
MHQTQLKKQTNPDNNEAIIELHKVEKTYQSAAETWESFSNSFNFCPICRCWITSACRWIFVGPSRRVNAAARR